jgi:hypothetical protein
MTSSKIIEQILYKAHKAGVADVVFELVQTQLQVTPTADLCALYYQALKQAKQSVLK